MGDRATFATRFGAVMTLIGVAVGLGNVWRFPYMVGEFGGAAFVLLYAGIAVVVGVPALMAELALGRHTRRGPIGAFATAGLPYGRAAGWFFFSVVMAATAYYVVVIGWVLFHAAAELLLSVGVRVDRAAILPPDTGFALRSFVLQAGATGAVILACAAVLLKGLRAGIERASVVIIPCLGLILVVLLWRALTLDGALEGVRWYILKVRFADLTPPVAMAALGQVVFSLSLGGTFMVVYGSYLDARASLASSAVLTTAADTISGLVAGMAIFPAVFALGLEPSSGPGLVFATLPRVFDAMPLGWFFGLLFFAGLFGAGYLSAVAAYEVLVAGLTDSGLTSRSRAVWITAAATFALSLPPSINNSIFVPWDLTFGSGMQTLGSLCALVTLGWCVQRSRALEELSSMGEHPVPVWLIHWIRFGIPVAIAGVGAWWLFTSVLGARAGA